MSPVKRILALILSAIFIVTMISSCENSSAPLSVGGSEFHQYSSFRDIPGVTEDIIAEIEEIRRQTDSFVYGSLLTTEAFYDDVTGEINGFSALFSEWLTKLFDIEFQPAIYEWTDLTDGLENGEIDFTGELTATEERKNPTDPTKKPYYMTGTIAERMVKIVRLPNSVPLLEIGVSRTLHYGFLRDTTTISDVTLMIQEPFEAFVADNYEAAYKLLIDGTIDGFIDEGTAEASFEEYGDVVVDEFFPMIYSSVSLTTLKPELAPILTVIQKALENGALYYLTELYNAGHSLYVQNKLRKQLTEEELVYIQNNPVIPYAAEYDNYPVSFYDVYEKEWRGISFDVLHEIEKLTGLRFTLVNDEYTEWRDLLEMLEGGDAAIISELIPSEDREGRFLWPKSTIMTDYYALLSKVDFADLSTNEILYAKVGLAYNTAHAALFKNWFPNHMNTVEYETIYELFDALGKGEIDVAMSSQNQLLILTHYRELAGYKANIVFNRPFDATFGFNKDQVILCSIVDKALGLIDTNGISMQWTHRTYDYRAKLAQAQRPWLIGTFVLFACVLVLLLLIFWRKHNEGRHLQTLVNERTNELENQTALLTSVFDTIPDFVFCKDLDLKYTRFNKKMEDYFDVREADIIGKDDKDGLGVPEEMVRMCNESDQAVLKNRKLTVSEEIVPGANGATLLCETVKVPIIKSGTVMGLLGVSRDITERKKSEEAIVMREKMTNTLNEMAIVFLTQDDMPFEEKMTIGVKPIADIIGVDCVTIWRTFAMPDDQYTSQIYRWDAKLGGTVPPPEKWQNRRAAELTPHWKTISGGEKTLNGPVRLMEDAPEGFKSAGVVSALLIPLTFNNENWGFVIFEDMHKERRFEAIEVMRSAAFLCANAIIRLEMENKLKEAFHNATVASRAKSNFLANMSHEIRTPMNAILGMTNIGKSAADIERMLYCFSKIGDASTHLLGIINDILDMSKIEAGKFELAPIEFNFEKMLQRVVNVINFRVDEKEQKFTVYVDRDIPQFVIGDEQRLAQVLTNLLGNAAKFTPVKGAIGVNTYFSGEENGLCTIKISVRDTGIGISPEQQAKLFQSFQQAENSTSRKFGGTGLGLAISKNIVEMMGGEISVESELGKGAVFTFTIQVGRGEKKHQTHTNRNQENVNWENVRVLVIDDDEYILEDFNGIITRLGTSCDIAKNADDALKLVEKNGDYDIYFVDWKMPDADGIDFTRELKKAAKHPGDSLVVMISAVEISTIVLEAKEAGVERFLQKPLFPSAIADIIDDYLGLSAEQSDDDSKNYAGIFKERHILLAEDVDINREIVAALLEETEIKIDYAVNGVEAVRAYSAAPDKYDMIFMDLQMPELDGYEATRQIRALDVAYAKIVPIIAMTANVFREDVEKCLESGMNGHIGKPLDFDEVIGTLKKNLRKQ